MEYPETYLKEIENIIEPIDLIFVKHHNSTKIKHIKPVQKKLYSQDRNKLCPCGSNKKFKKCCINKLKNEKTSSITMV